MAPSNQSSTVMRVTKLNRNGAGQLDETDTVFEWSGLSHSSMQGILQMKLGTKIARKVLPGNIVVHQAMSATWEPMTLKGEWRDIWMGRGEANRIYLAFARLAEKLPFVRVTVDGQSFVGMIMDPEFGYHHEGWIEWQFTLSPESNENVTSDVDLGTGGPILQKSVPQWFQEAVDKTAKIHDGIDSAQDLAVSTEDLISADQSTNELDDAMSRVAELSNFVGMTNDFVTAETNNGTDITDAVWALPTAYERTMRAAINIAMTVSGNRADTAVAYDDFILALEYELFVHSTTMNAWDMVGHSIDAARDMRSKSSQRPRAIYRPAPGESLERISMRFYGTADNADLLYRANHLNSIVLDGTEELLIPEIGA